MSLMVPEITVDIESLEISVAQPSVEVEAIVAQMPAVSIAVPGPAGITRIDHGADPAVPRPSAPIVLWVGSVTPSNRDEAVDLIAWTA